jgi:MFS family permease
MLLIDGLRDISFQFSENLFPCICRNSAGFLQQIGWVMSFFGLAMMLSTIPGGWLSDKAGERVGIATGMVLCLHRFSYW